MEIFRRQSGTGLPSSVIGHIEADGPGIFLDEFLWRHFARERNGFEPLRRREAGRGVVLTYGINDGLPTAGMFGRLAASGWQNGGRAAVVSHAKGLVAVDRGESKSICCLRRCGSKRCAWTTRNSRTAPPSGRLKIPPGRHRIEFEYTGLSFVAPEKVRFNAG